MQIEVIETFSHDTGCFLMGRTYEVSDALGDEVVKANLAKLVPVEPEQKPVEPEPKKKADKEAK